MKILKMIGRKLLVRRIARCLRELDQIDLALSAARYVPVAGPVLASLRKREEALLRWFTENGMVSAVVKRRSWPVGIDETGRMVRLPWSLDEVPENWWRQYDSAASEVNQ